MQPTETTDDRLRLAEVLAALSLVTDLGMGQPPEEAMVACLLATRLGEEMNLSEEQMRDVYYTALLRHVGCTASAHEESSAFGGDELAARAVASRTDFTRPRETLSFLAHLGKERGGVGRAPILARAVASGMRAGDRIQRAICEVAAGMARRLGLGSGVQQGLYQIFERWDGKGVPQKLAGDSISLAARLAQLASQAALFARLGGSDAAVRIVRARAGTWLDPGLAEVFVRRSSALIEDIASTDPSRAVVEAEPEPRVVVTEAGLDEVAEAFADMVDLKSPFFHEHSSGVARLAEKAGRECSLPREQVIALRRAALFHDLGRVGVPNGVWEKAGPLTLSEWEQVRLHPYLTERVLIRSPVLAPLASVACAHHERQDGSGYPRRASAAILPTASRILAAADAYQAMTQDRAHRRALSLEAAAKQLATEARQHRLDHEAVEAVLLAAGAPSVRTRRSWPAGLTDREVEVLRLITTGCSNRDIARRLYISPKTAGHHVQHIYTKIGVSTRAAAAMFAMEHDLLTR